MKYIILGVWGIQAVAGLTLLVGWARHARGKGAAPVIAHAVIMLACLASWTVFVFTDAILWGWLAWVVLALGIPLGETQMVVRARRARHSNATRMAAYGLAIRSAFAGQLPPLVTFHAIFSAAVFFGSLAYLIGVAIAG